MTPPRLTDRAALAAHRLRALRRGNGAAQALRDAVLGQAEVVANAAGGFLGLGDRVSAAERSVLRELSAALEV